MDGVRRRRHQRRRLKRRATPTRRFVSKHGSAAWVTIRESVAAGTLRTSDKGLAEVISRWEQLLRFAALRLGRELGADVEVQLSRKQESEATRTISLQAHSLVERGVLPGSIRIPGAVAPIDIAVDVRAGKVTVSLDIDAPKEGRATPGSAGSSSTPRRP